MKEWNIRELQCCVFLKQRLSQVRWEGLIYFWLRTRFQNNIIRNCKEDFEKKMQTIISIHADQQYTISKVITVTLKFE